MRNKMSVFMASMQVMNRVAKIKKQYKKNKNLKSEK